MNAAFPHPDQLQSGDMVGPWCILDPLHTSPSMHIYMVERDSKFFTLKMSRQAGSEAPPPGERHANARLDVEGTTLVAWKRSAQLPYLYSVGWWPLLKTDYRYLVTDYVGGDSLHHWRWHNPPSLAKLTDVFCELVRRVEDIHGRGLFLRDLRAEHILIRDSDAQPLLRDFCSAGPPTLPAWRPPEDALYSQPPEFIAFLRQGGCERGEPFTWTVAADLYLLGALFYECLTDNHAFDPKLSTEVLLDTIEFDAPRAPHYLNPNVPRPLGEVALKLLSKEPEARYASTEQLLQGLWNASKARHHPEWKARLEIPEEPPTVSDEEWTELLFQKREARRRERKAALPAPPEPEEPPLPLTPEAIVARVYPDEELWRTMERLRPRPSPLQRLWPLVMVATTCYLLLLQHVWREYRPLLGGEPTASADLRAEPSPPPPPPVE